MAEDKISVLGGTSKYVKNLTKHRFDINLSAIFKGEKNPIPIQGNIRDMTVYNFYETNVFPVVQFEFYFDWSMYTRIQMNADTVKFKLELRKTKLSDGAAETGSFYDIIINNAILKPFDITRSPIDAPRETDGTANSDSNFYMKADCFLEEHLNINKSLISAVIKDANIKDTILFALNQGGATRGLIMDDPENTYIMEQILLPSFNTTNTISYLNEIYGIYQSGLRMFFDFNVNYILAKDFKNHKPKVQTGEWGTVLIELADMTNVTPDNMGIFRDLKNKTYYVKLPNASEYIVQDTSLREIAGENVKFLSWHTENVNVARVQKTSIGSTGLKDIDVTNSSKIKQRLLWNRYSNRMAESAYTADMGRSMSRLRIPFSEMDLSIFTMNKRYEVNYSNLQYKHLAGTYQLTSLIYKFSKGETGRLYNVHGVGEFERLGEGLLK